MSTPARRAAAADVALSLPVGVASVGGTWWLLGLSTSYLAVSVVLFAVGAVGLLATLPDDLPEPGIGPANRVTLGRGLLALPVLSLAVWSLPTAWGAASSVVGIGAPAELGPTALWWVIVLSTVVLVLDGVDGRVARRTGTETEFGARFDMELDAALIMALSALVRASGRAGVWVLLIGLMRYLFVAASRIWPVLAGPLPPSLRRKVVCVVQGVVLLVALGPIIPREMALAVCAAGLLALGWSFAVDVAWLARAAP